jgi:peroxin-11B
MLTDLRSTVGRDKFLRTLQYFSRFYAWYLYRTNHPQSSIAPFEAIKKQFGLARKIMRIGKFVEHFKAAAQAADTKAMDPVLRYLAVGRQLGYAGYMFLDNLTVADAIGARKSAATKSLQREAYRMWFAGLTFNIAAGLYTLYRLRERSTAIEKSADAEKVVESKKLERYVFKFDSIFEANEAFCAGRAAPPGCNSSRIFAI